MGSPGIPSPFVGLELGAFKRDFMREMHDVQQGSPSRTQHHRASHGLPHAAVNMGVQIAL